MVERLTKNKLKQFARIQDKSFRRESGLFLIEGIHAMEELLANGYQPVWITVESRFESAHPALTTTLASRFPNTMWSCSKVEFGRLSQTESSQGIVAAVPKRKPQHPPPPCQLMIALDGISDPGNLGTILRSADWFGVETILMNTSCVELHNPKVVRTTMGSIFRLNCIEGVDLAAELTNLKASGYEILGASSDQGAAPLRSIPVRPTVLVIGSESHGLSRDVRSACSQLTRIERIGAGESLNAAVATSILLYEITRDRGNRSQRTGGAG